MIIGERVAHLQPRGHESLNRVTMRTIKKIALGNVSFRIRYLFMEECVFGCWSPESLELSITLCF